MIFVLFISLKYFYFSYSFSNFKLKTKLITVCCQGNISHFKFKLFFFKLIFIFYFNYVILIVLVLVVLSGSVTMAINFRVCFLPTQCFTNKMLGWINEWLCLSDDRGDVSVRSFGAVGEPGCLWGRWAGWSSGKSKRQSEASQPMYVYILLQPLDLLPFS